MRNKNLTKKSSKEVVNNKATFDFYTSFSFFPFYFQIIPWQSGIIVMSFIDKKLSYITEKTKDDMLYIRSSRAEVLCKKGVLRNFAKFAGKHLFRVSFLIKLQATARIFIKKETQVHVLSCEFCENSKNTLFSLNISGGCFCIF